MTTLEMKACLVAFIKSTPERNRVIRNSYIDRVTWARSRRLQKKQDDMETDENDNEV